MKKLCGLLLVVIFFLISDGLVYATPNCVVTSNNDVVEANSTEDITFTITNNSEDEEIAVFALFPVLGTIIDVAGDPSLGNWLKFQTPPGYSYGGGSIDELGSSVEVTMTVTTGNSAMSVVEWSIQASQETYGENPYNCIIHGEAAPIAESTPTPNTTTVTVTEEV